MNKRIISGLIALAVVFGSVSLPAESGLNLFDDTAIMAEAAEGKGVAINAANFPDENFRKYVSEKFDTDGDGYLSSDEIEAVTEIDCNWRNTKDLTGIEYFVNLQLLSCANNQLTSLDVSKNTALIGLYCSSNQLTELDVSKNTALVELYCSDNRLTELDVSQNTMLVYLYCVNNRLTSLDVSQNTMLVYLLCYSNQLTELDVSKNTVLAVLDCSGNQLTELDLSKNTALGDLACSHNQLTELDVSGCTALEDLDCYRNQLTILDVSSCTSLSKLDCSVNQLTLLDVSKNAALGNLYCHSNQLTVLDLRACPRLISAYLNAEPRIDDAGCVWYSYSDEESSGYLSVDNGLKVITDDSQIEDEISGSIKVNGDKNNDTEGMEITFTDADGKTKKATISIDSTFTVSSLADGTYTLTASKPNCAPRDYNVTIKNGAPTEDIAVELNLFGDLDGDGSVSIFDSLKVNKHVKRTGSLEGYDLSIADVDSSGDVNIFDCMKINSHVKKTAALW